MSEESVDAQAPESSGADNEERPEQSVTVEDVGPARKCLTIEIPEERIESTISDSYSKLKNDANIPGFRRGRAPIRLIEKRFASGVRDDVRGQLISESFSQAIEDQKLEAIGEPEIKDLDDIKLPDSGPMTFKVEIEVSPDVVLPDLDGIDVKRPTVEVTDELIDGEIDGFRNRLGKTSKVSDEKVQRRDYVTADVSILAGENAGDDAELIENYPTAFILVGHDDVDDKGHITGILIEDLVSRFVDKTSGDGVVISMTGPAAHENETIKGQPITIKARIDEIERLEPMATEALTKQFGLDTPEELRDQIKQSLESRRDHEQQIAMRQHVSDYLLEKTEFDLPEQITARQAERSLQQRSMELMYRGVPQQEIEQKLAEMREDQEQQSRRSLKLFFILEKAANTLSIEVSDMEINGQIATMARQQNRRPEKLRQQMQRGGQLDSLHRQIREQKTLDKILEKANVSDAPAEEPEAEAAD